MGSRGGLSGGGNPARATALTSESERQSAADSVCGSTARTPAWHEEKRENLAPPASSEPAKPELKP